MSGRFNTKGVIFQGVFIGLALASAFFCGFLILAPQVKWYKKLEDIKKSSEFCKIKDDVEQDDKTIFSDQSVFRNAKWSTIRKVITKYKNYSEIGIMIKFRETFKDFSYDNFKSDVLDKAKKYFFYDLFITLIVACFLVIILTITICANKEDAPFAQSSEESISESNNDVSSEIDGTRNSMYVNKKEGYYIFSDGDERAIIFDSDVSGKVAEKGVLHFVDGGIKI